MEGPVWAILGLLILVLLVAFVLTLPNFVPGGPADLFKGFYETYLDVFVISIATAAALLGLGFAIPIVISRGTSKDLYILSALFLLAIKSVLLIIDTLMATPGRWLLSSVAHLFDFAIIGFLILALRETL